MHSGADWTGVVFAFDRDHAEAIGLKRVRRHEGRRAQLRVVKCEHAIGELVAAHFERMRDHGAITAAECVERIAKWTE
jgi:hypothetical protein